MRVNGPWSRYWNGISPFLSFNLQVLDSSCRNYGRENALGERCYKFCNLGGHGQNWGKDQEWWVRRADGWAWCQLGGGRQRRKDQSNLALGSWSQLADFPFGHQQHQQQHLWQIVRAVLVDSLVWKNTKSKSEQSRNIAGIQLDHCANMHFLWDSLSVYYRFSSRLVWPLNHCMPGCMPLVLVAESADPKVLVEVKTVMAFKRQGGKVIRYYFRWIIRQYVQFFGFVYRSESAHVMPLFTTEAHYHSRRRFRKQPRPRRLTWQLLARCYQRMGKRTYLSWQHSVCMDG